MLRRKGRGASTSYAEYAAMKEWLQIPQNFCLIVGSAGAQQSVVAGAKVRKVDGYSDLAIFVNSKCGSNWDSETAKCRYMSYLKKFKQTFRALKDNINWCKIYAYC